MLHRLNGREQILEEHTYVVNTEKIRKLCLQKVGLEEMGHQRNTIKPQSKENKSQPEKEKRKGKTLSPFSQLTTQFLFSLNKHLG